MLDARRPRRRLLELPRPIIDNDELDKLMHVEEGRLRLEGPHHLDGLYPVAEGGDGLRAAIERIRDRVLRGDRRRARRS